MKSDRIEAFQEIYNAYYGEVYRFLQGTSERGTDLEIATQGIFLQAYRLFPQYRGETSYKTWLFSIALTSQSNWRKFLRRGKQQGQDIAEQVEESVSAGSEDSERLHRRLIQQVVAAYWRLSQAERSILVLDMVYGLSRPDLALVLNVSEGRARTLAEDALHKLWTSVDMDARGLIEEALCSMYGQPTDLELMPCKTEGWAVVLKQGARAAMRKRWMPLAGVAVMALVVAGAVFLPGELKKESAPAGPVKSLEEQIQIPGQTSEFGSYEHTKLRWEHYEKNKQQMVYSNIGEANPVDILLATDGLYTVKWDDQQGTGVKKMILPIQSRQESVVRGVTPPYLLLSIVEPINTTVKKESLYTLDLRDLKLTPLPVSMDGGKLLSGGIVEQGTPLLYYLFEEGKTSDVLLYSYNLQTGEEKLLYTGQQDRRISRLEMQGPNILLAAEKELLLVKDDGVQSIVKQDVGYLHPISLMSGNATTLIYEAMESDQNPGEERYHEHVKIMSYDIKAGTAKPLLPVEKGAQQVFYNFSLKSDDILISNFIPSQPPETMESHGTLPGRVQLWHVQVGKEAKMFYEREVPFGKRGAMFYSNADKDGRQLFLKSQRTEEWAIRYDMDSGAVTEVDPKTLPKDRP